MYLQNSDDDNFYPDDDHDLMDDDENEAPLLPGELPDETEEDGLVGGIGDLDDLESATERPGQPKKSLPRKEEEDSLAIDFENES